MRRRLQGIPHTDCTDRVNLGRRNRYALAAATITGTPAVDNESASRAPKSGNGGSFSEVGAEQMNSSRRSCVNYIFSGGSAPVFNLRNFNNITAKTTANPVSEGFSCPPPHNAVRQSFAVRIDTQSHDRYIINSGTPVVNNRTLNHPALGLRRAVSFPDTDIYARPQHSPESYDGGRCMSISNNAEVPDANLHSLLPSEKCRLTSSALFFSTPYDKGRPFRSIHVGNYTDLNRMRSSFSGVIRQKERECISYSRSVCIHRRMQLHSARIISRTALNLGGRLYQTVGSSCVFISRQLNLIL